MTMTDPRTEPVDETQLVPYEQQKLEYIAEQRSFYSRDDLTPLDIQPVDINDYPMAIEYCERLVAARKKSISGIQLLIQAIEDDKAREVAKEVETFMVGKTMKTKKKYSNAEEREREVRWRCQIEHDKYSQYVRAVVELQAQLGDWQARYNKLRRELRLLEHEYVTTGERIFKQHSGRTFDGGGESI